MIDMLRSLRRGPGDHRAVFAEFGTTLVFVIAAAMAKRRGEARLRVVR